MASFRSHRWRRDALLAAALAIAGLASFSAPSASCQSAHASDILPADYCFQTDIAVTYSGSGDLTNKPVRIVMNASGMIGSGQLDANAWDIKPIQGSLANEVHLTAQELDSTASAWWVVLPAISEDQTRTLRFYSGSQEQRRDQGIWFTSKEYATVPDNAVFDITDNLALEFRVENLSDTPRGNIWAEHHNNAGGGYRVQFTTNAGVLNVLLVIDNRNCFLPWDSSWTGEEQDFRFEYIVATGNDAFIYRNGVLAQSCDLDAGAIETTTNPFTVGVVAGTEGSNTFTSARLTNAIISDIRLWDGTTEELHLGFDANRMTETVSTNPYEGTIDDYSSNAFTGTYVFDRDQSDFSYTIGPTQLVSGASQITLPDTNPDVLGPVFGVDPGASPSELQTGIFYDVFLQKWVGQAPVRSFGYASVLAIFGLFLAIAVYRLTKYVPLALFVFGIPLAVGVGNGWIPAWWMILWIVIAIGGWFAQRQTETP